MSQENIDVIQRATHAHNEHDIEGILESVHPEIEITLIGGFAEIFEESTFSGHAAVRRYYLDWFATFETVRVDHEKFIEASGQVLSLSRFELSRLSSNRTRSSGDSASCR
jgi:hypothetical protein